MPDRFARTVASLDTPGGQMIVCLIVILIGIACSVAHVSKGEDLIPLGAGGLFLAMKGKGAINHDTGAPQAGPLLPPIESLSTLPISIQSYQSKREQ